MSRLPSHLIAPLLALSVVPGGCGDLDRVAAPPDPLRGASVPAGFPAGIIASFDASAGERPEGIAMDKAGNLYVGISTTGDIYRLRPGRPGSGVVERSLFATLAPGLLGLAVDAVGNLYAGVASFDPATHGVWRVSPDGSRIRLPGSASIFFPNALAFDRRGNLYVTSSSGPPAGDGTFLDGEVWRIPRGGGAELWLRHPLLTGTASGITGLPFPLGANGIAFFQGELVVANTEKGWLVRVPVEGGDPGVPEILAGGFSFLDGLALDVHGDIYLLEIGLTRLVKVSRAEGSAEVLAGPFDGVDFATSLAFGTGEGDRESVFLANAALDFPHPDPDRSGPSVLKLELDVPGLPLP